MTTSLSGHANMCVEAPCGISPPWWVLWPQTLWYYRYSILICHMTSRVQTTQRFIWIYGWKPHTVSHHFDMFGGCWSNATGDIRNLMSRDFTKSRFWRSCNFMSGSSPWYVTTISSLVAIGIVIVAICFYLVMWSSKTTWLIISIGVHQGKLPSCLVWWL